MPLTRLRMDELVNAWVGDDDTPFHLGLLAVFDPGPFAGPDGVVDTGPVADELSRRARGVPELGRRVLWTRWGEGRPVWVEDPDDDLARHVEVRTLGPDADLATWSANRAATPLHRDRALWRADVVHGLPGGRFAVLLVVHHVLADGIGGLRLLASLLDEAPDAVHEYGPPRTAPVPAPPLPSHRDLVADHLRRWRPARDGQHRPRAPSLARACRALAQYRDAMSDFSGPLPRTSLPRVVGPTRRMSVTTAPLGPLRAGAHARGATVNDLLLAAVAQGLRDLLSARGECRESLFVRTIIPVSLDPSGQATSMMVVDLPVGEPDPARRLASITGRTSARKARLRATGGTGQDLLALPVPVARLIIPWARRRGSARIHLSVTNIPGPAHPLWFAGAQLVQAFPVAPLVPLVGLTVAALSYNGRLAVAVNADGTIRDLDTLRDGIAASLADRAREGHSADAAT
ncbi:wax ester/triacylglycerol synthase family O-acyltransferase [Fodinibacter luteus]|uniref:diacylglycerol O-acyltransferase n=1 Tax=Fodinibacter luteus TaxID=552064 RepID=A0ABP8KJ16_9MICO